MTNGATDDNGLPFWRAVGRENADDDAAIKAVTRKMVRHLLGLDNFIATIMMPVERIVVILALHYWMVVIEARPLWRLCHPPWTRGFVDDGTDK